MNPCLKTLDLVERGKLPPRRDERWLDGVLGAADVTQDPMRDGEQPSAEPRAMEANASSSPDRAASTSARSIHPAPLFASLGGTLHPL